MLRRSRKGCTELAVGQPLRGAASGDGPSAVAAMAKGQILHDVLQSGIRWRVTLLPSARPEGSPLVVFEKRGKGGRLLHWEQARWSLLHSGGFLTPREQVSGGLVPRCLVERIEAQLRGAELPRRRSEWGQVRGRLVRCTAPGSGRCG
jgi:hypothetical protein